MKPEETAFFCVTLVTICLTHASGQQISNPVSGTISFSSSKKSPSYVLQTSDPLPWIQKDRRRSDRVLRSVLDAYKVMNNTIIQTKESRALGAKYLNETNQVSRDFCLKWCSDYQNVNQDFVSVSCNVAVFEEVGRKSCYLFDCGPPGPEFKCQFTAHASYSSSILNRASVDLSEWRDQNDHETQLLLLKGQSIRSPSPDPVLNAADPIPQKSTPTLANNVQAEIHKKECQHFQFPCTNSSECIAIYNVCDGIPQCPDSSDEAPERCSPTAPSTPAQPVVRMTESPIFLEQNLLNEEEAERMRKQLLETRHATSHESGNLFHYPKAAAAAASAQPAAGLRQPFFPRPYSLISEDKKMIVPQLAPAPQTPALIPSQPQENNFYANYPFFSPVEYFSPADVTRRTGSVAFKSPQVPGDYGRESGGTAAAPGLLWSVLSDPQKAPPDPAQILISPPASPYHLRSGQRAGDPAMGPIRGSNDQIGFWGEGMPYLDPGVSSRRTLFPVSQFGKPQSSTSIPLVPSSTISVNSMPSHPSYALSDKRRSQSVLEHKASHDIPIAVSHLRESDESGQDTNSAVIALSLGICITFMLAGIVAIRMRSIRQRISRRGGRSLAHDADYLVNGMYL